MYKKILLPTDGSTYADEEVERASKLIADDGEIIVLSVAGKLTSSAFQKRSNVKKINKGMVEEAKAAVEHMCSKFSDDLNVTPLVEVGFAADKINEVTKRENVNCQINLFETIDIDGYGSFHLTDNIKDCDSFIQISYDEPLPLTIRKRCEGDRLIIGSGHKKLKDFLIDKKVPITDRDKLIVVTNANDEIIWVLGYYKKACELMFERPISRVLIYSVPLAKTVEI